MDVENREWWIKFEGMDEGPIGEDDFQSRLRAGELPLKALIKSNFMESFEPLLTVVTTDQTFRRPSKLPPSA